MARKNRLVVDNGIYHLTSRIANQEMFLRDSTFKDKLVTWLYGIADFSGVEVLSWCIMNNHFHLLVHVPPVPKKYWTDQDLKPETSAFSMRPGECRSPRWLPDKATPITITPAGDSPSSKAYDIANIDGVPLVDVPRPMTGFILSDDEMLARIARLEDGNSPKRVSKLRDRWRYMRCNGMNNDVDSEKESFCRRMYNVSQFMKTFKQRVSQYFNKQSGHTGHFWSDRFYSGLVENEMKVRACVAAYIDWNAPRAKLVAHPRDWNWCSYSCAVSNGKYSMRARFGYEKVFGCCWKEAHKILERIFSSKGIDNNQDKKREDGLRKQQLCISNVIRRRVEEISKGWFISRDRSYAKDILKHLPKHFPAPSMQSICFFERLDWSDNVLNIIC